MFSNLNSLTTAYNASDVARLMRSLEKGGALSFAPLSTGLFPASPGGGLSTSSGYQAVWVRDNVYVAYALARMGAEGAAARCARALTRWFQTQRVRLDTAIQAGAPPLSPMDRPHVRFDGVAFAEIDEPWNHAQNDAVGYFLWLYARFVSCEVLSPDPEDLEIIGRLALYLKAIEYWHDEDSGHWEEAPKIQASSVGVVLAGLIAVEDLLRQCGPVSVRVGRSTFEVGVGDLERPIENGRQALDSILPSECVQDDSRKRRRYDAALLFLIYPLGVIGGALARRIVDETEQVLAGDIGIRRYLGDTFWCPEYRQLPVSIRTAPVEKREQWFSANEWPVLAVERQAQWCLFDAFLSVICGRWYQETGDLEWHDRQIQHFNRSLDQIVVVHDSSRLMCPELYFLENDSWRPNDALPLLWSQAGLSLALAQAQAVASPVRTRTV